MPAEVLPPPLPTGRSATTVRPPASNSTRQWPAMHAPPVCSVARARSPSWRERRCWAAGSITSADSAPSSSANTSDISRDT
ncbi:hypothetical protein ABZX82_20590 [Streptomyces griseoflavus]|uniref:hypothetical protein n=1 Tax=Streptomyces griseoflavus TaxID=35619 RepID=UPI001E2F371F|nr:hypothetical protein [Streptomyces griseoflavus]